MDLSVKALFDRSLAATGVTIDVPVPPQTARVNIKKSKGEARYDGSAGVIRWTLSKFRGLKEHRLSADVMLVSTTREKKPWNRCVPHSLASCILNGSLVCCHIAMLVWQQSQCLLYCAPSMNIQESFLLLLKGWKCPHTLRLHAAARSKQACLAHAEHDALLCRPPVTMAFSVPMFSASPLKVTFLKVAERSNYNVEKWVRKVCVSGTYNCRIK